MAALWDPEPWAHSALSHRDRDTCSPSWAESKQITEQGLGRVNPFWSLPIHSWVWDLDTSEMWGPEDSH